MDEETDYANVKVHFGKNAETRVGELRRRSREWYARDGWAENKSEPGREVTDRDRLLRRACRALHGLPLDETEGPFRL